MPCQETMSSGDNLREMSKPIFWEKKRKKNSPEREREREIERERERGRESERERESGSYNNSLLYVGT